MQLDFPGREEARSGTYIEESLAASFSELRRRFISFPRGEKRQEEECSFLWCKDTLRYGRESIVKDNKIEAEESKQCLLVMKRGDGIHKKMKQGMNSVRIDMQSQIEWCTTSLSFSSFCFIHSLLKGSWEENCMCNKRTNKCNNKEERIQNSMRNKIPKTMNERE